MSHEKLNEILVELNGSSEDILLSMVLTSDGLVIGHEGNVKEPDMFGAYFVELQLVCEKILSELDYDGVEEIFLRSASGCVTVVPIQAKGFLACMSTPRLNASKLQMVTWKAVRSLADTI